MTSMSPHQIKWKCLQINKNDRTEYGGVPCHPNTGEEGQGSWFKTSQGWVGRPLSKQTSKQASKQANKDKDIEVAAEWRDILMKYLLVYFFHRKWILAKLRLYFHWTVMNSKHTVVYSMVPMHFRPSNINERKELLSRNGVLWFRISNSQTW